MPRNTLVVGMGISGRSVCELLLRQGAQVIATDLKNRDQFGGVLDSLESRGCTLRLGSHRREDFLGADRIIVSPGVPLNVEPLKEAAVSGIEIVGELEWAWRQVKVPVVAVTGTNGKTTTTSLIGEILKKSGRRVFVGGNIGTPLSRWVLEGGEADVLVLEVSSFQLDTASRFKPDVGILLNVTEDHLDRYENFAAYVDSKFSIFARQKDTDVGVLNGDDPVCRARQGGLPKRMLVYSRTDRKAHARIEDRRLRVALAGKEPWDIGLDQVHLKGIHNEENLLAAVLTTATMGVAPWVIQEAVDQYSGLPHRLEWVRTWKGIDFFDDSKATNVGAVVKALESFDRPVLLLLGGRDKLGSYGPLAEPLKKTKGVFIYGEAAPRIFQEVKKWSAAKSYLLLEEAFVEAVLQGTSGDVVLLSPACSSFDQYESYAERGDHFKRLVGGL